MISIDRLEEMAIEELETKLNNWKEQVELQSNFIDSLLKATNNSEWLDKTILDDEAAEIIEKIELDYAQLDQLKVENKDLKEEIRLIHDDCKGCSTCFNALESARIYCVENQNLKQTLTEIKEIAEKNLNIHTCAFKGCGYDLITKQILQKISECEGNNGT